MRTVLLDLDDTLMDFHKAEETAIKEALAAFGLPSDDETARLYSRINDSQWKLLEQGKITREQVLTRRFELLFEQLGVQPDVPAMRNRYETNLSGNGFLLPGAVELLRELQKDCALYIVSNGTAAIQDKRIAKAGIAPFFRDIFISQRIGVNKPDPRFFDYCLSHMPADDRENLLLIGDSLTSDILGGLRSNIPTVWFNPRHLPENPDIRPTYTTDSLAEIPAIVNRHFGKS